MKLNICIQYGLPQDIIDRFLNKFDEYNIVASDEADVILVDHDSDFFAKVMCGFDGMIYTFLSSGEFVKVQ